MAIVNLKPPDKNCIAFVFENTPDWDCLRTPEGEFRITFWYQLAFPILRSYVDGGGTSQTLEDAVPVNQAIANLFVQGPYIQPQNRGSSNPSKYQSMLESKVVVNMNTRLITTQPVQEKKREKYFSQNTISNFGMDIYDTDSVSDIFSVIGAKFQPSFSADVHLRFINQFLNPLNLFSVLSDTIDGDVNSPNYGNSLIPQLNIYCLVEYKTIYEKDFKVWSVGQMQTVMKGKDLNWYSADNSNPFLSDLNKESNADRIWSTEFISLSLAALGRTSIRPDIDSRNRSYPMTLYDPRGGRTERPYGDRNDGVKGKVLQLVDNIKYVNDANGKTYAARWNKHIPAGKWIKDFMTYSYGEGNFTFVCENSPYRFAGGQLYTDGFTRVVDGNGEKIYSTSGVTPLLGDDKIVTINAHWDADPHNWILIPQCLFGLYDFLDIEAIDNPVPIPQVTWASTFQSLWDGLLEFCLTFGWEPFLDEDYSGAVPKAVLTFRAKGSVEENSFSTILPESANPETAPETENGIRITRRTTFKNATTVDGDFADWFATRIGDNVLDGNNHLNLLPEKQPYTIPATAQNPATLDLSMVMGADLCALYNGINEEEACWWYGISMPSNDLTVLAVQAGENFPMFSPLICTGEADLSSFTPDGGDSANDLALLFSPVIQGYFTHPTTKETVTCDSFSSLVANFNALYYTHSQIKYSLTFPTLIQFTDTTVKNVGNKKVKSKTYGQRDWRFLDLYFLTNYFGDDYFVHSIKRDPNSMKTTIELFLTVVNKPNYSPQIKIQAAGGGTLPPPPPPSKFPFVVDNPTGSPRVDVMDTYTIPDGLTIGITIKVVARRRAVYSGGAVGDSFYYKMEDSYKNVAGVVSRVGVFGTVDPPLSDIDGCDFNIDIFATGIKMEVTTPAQTKIAYNRSIDILSVT